MAKKIYRAGLIPYQIVDGKIEMMFMVPSDPKFGGSSPQICKGKVEENESNKTAALREAEEELGLFTKNIVGETIELGTFLGRTAVFIAEIEHRDLFGDTTFETERVVWMGLDEFLANGRDIHKPVVKAAIRKIESLNSIN